MGWGSFAEKLNRTIGGYDSDEKKNLSEEAASEIKVEPMILPPKPAVATLPENGMASADFKKWAPGKGNSIYDAPAITRDSMPVTNAPLSVSKPKKARKPKP
jgi:hypothetical protein